MMNSYREQLANQPLTPDDLRLFTTANAMAARMQREASAATLEMAEVLTLAKEKLHLYRVKSGGEYVGGLEYSALMKRIDETLAKARAPG